VFFLPFLICPVVVVSTTTTFRIITTRVVGATANAERQRHPTIRTATRGTAKLIVEPQTILKCGIRKRRKTTTATAAAIIYQGLMKRRQKKCSPKLPILMIQPQPIWKVCTNVLQHQHHDQIMFEYIQTMVVGTSTGVITSHAENL